MPAPQILVGSIHYCNHSIACPESVGNTEIDIAILIMNVEQHLSFSRSCCCAVASPNQRCGGNFGCADVLAYSGKVCSAVAPYSCLELVVAGSGNYVAVGCTGSTEVDPGHS